MIELKTTVKSHLNLILNMEEEEDNQEFIIPYTRTQHENTMRDQDALHLSAFNDVGQLVGFVILAGLQNQNDAIEFRRIVIAKKGQGYGSEVIKQVKKLAFEQKNAQRLWLDVFDYNTKAQYIYLKSGFKKEGILRNAFKRDDFYQSLVIMSILKEEYEAV